jgi:hypothetical protein
MYSIQYYPQFHVTMVGLGKKLTVGTVAIMYSIPLYQQLFTCPPKCGCYYYSVPCVCICVCACVCVSVCVRARARMCVCYFPLISLSLLKWNLCWWKSYIHSFSVQLFCPQCNVQLNCAVHTALLCNRFLTHNMLLKQPSTELVSP